VSVTEWLLWIATVWAVFLAFAIVDVPTLFGRAASHVHLPHWVQHIPHHGRHARGGER
jgi:hypothetical protein